MNETYEIELVKQMRDGDISSFHEIVDTYKKKVYFIAYDICGDRHEAEDISQEVFIKVFRFIKKFRMDSKLSTWIYQVSVNTAIDAVRKHKKKQVLMETAEMDAIPPGPDANGETEPEHLAARNQMRQQVQQALPALSKKERAVFVLRYFSEFKLLEVAEIMEISINSTKTLLLRAKRKLQKKLAAYNREGAL